MMRIGLFSLFLVFTIGVSNAQGFYEKFFFAPGLSYSSNSNYSKYDAEKTDKNKNSTFGMDLPIGYFIAENTVVGLVPDYYRTQSTYVHIYTGGEPVESTSTLSMFGIGIFARQYVSLSDRINIFAAGEGSYGTGSRKNQADNEDPMEYTINGFMAQVYPGLNFGLTDSMFLELSIGSLSYSHTSSKDKEASEDAPTDHSDSFGLMFIL